MTSFDYTNMTREAAREAARTAAEAIRYLNHATRSPGALEYPSDADAILAALETVTQRLPQLLGQLGAWLTREYEAGRVEVTHGPYAGRPGVAVPVVRHDFTSASARAEALLEELHEARQVTATLGAPGPEEGEQAGG